MPMWRPDLYANPGQSGLNPVLVEVDARRQVSVSSKEYKAADSERGGNKSQLISFWCKMRNVGVLSSSDEDFIEELKRWATANGYRVEQL